MVLLDQKLMKDNSHYCGFVGVLSYEISIVFHFVISINRFCAVWTPFKYQQIFNINNTCVVILMIWVVVGTIDVILYEWYCHFYFDDSIGFLTFNNSELCSDIGWYGDFVKNSFIVAVVLCFDIITIIGVRRVSKKLKSGMTDATIKKFSRRDRRFLKQTLIQGSVFMLELLTYFFIPQYFTNRWIVFFGTSFAWVAVHVADGLIVIICNPEIRNFLLADKTSLRRGTILQVSSVVVYPQ
ncbi:hypothetical protein GCK72_020019 [Caenorhabditis remanei]|uniref:G-protein coupled receptors family 1 profile domain-containing protein n=1 Tax=Caenorhabditis remanei TaxID=31234 RepID=A0A6A5GG48_CAERE|nr:hypothetical protein GCK72_020019 [Caenorhabditis remanei]KAF1753462.1 hypothetical protein GCK72_020019 [Caenorhabditis remanei]